MLLLIAPTVRLPRTRGVPTSLLEYGRDFLTPPVLFFLTWLFLFTLHWGAEATSLALFLEHNLGLSPLGVGVYMAGEFGVVGLTAYLYGRFWAGRLKPLTFLALALIFSGAGHILMTYPALPWSFARRAVHGFGDGLILMETYTTITRLFHVDRIGGSASLISLTTTLGIFAGSLIFGPLGAALRLCGAAHRLRGHQPGAAAPGLRGVAGVKAPIGKKTQCPRSAGGPHCSRTNWAGCII